MKLKKELFILAAIIIALSVYLVVRKQDRALYELPTLPPVTGSDINRIEIEGPRTNLVLKRIDQNWTVGEEKYPVTKSKVQQMIDTIERLALTELISASGDLARYDLTADKKIRVRAYTGDALQREFEIGKTAPSYRHTFVQIAGNPNVYNARDSFRDKFDQQVSDLRDKQVLSFAASDIQQIQVSKGTASLLLERKETAADKGDGQPSEQRTTTPVKTETIWQSSDGEKADQARLDRLLTTLSQLSCDSFVADRRKSDFSSPIYQIRVTGPQSHELAIFDKLNKDADNNPAISSQNPYPFYLPDWQVKNLTPAFTELLLDSKSE